MKKILYSLLIFTSLFIFSNGVKANCYENTCKLGNGLIAYEPEGTTGPNDNSNTSDDSTSNTSYEKIECGDVKVPYLIPKTISTIITILQIATPIIIIVVGSLDLVKAVMAQKDDEIKKGQQTFLKRLMVGAVVFLVFVIVKVLLGVVAPRDGDYTNMWSCIDCFVTGECDSVKVN